MAAADQPSRTQIFPPPRKKSCMKPWANMCIQSDSPLSIV